MPNRAEPRRDLIVIGASAGGVDALRRIVRQLPADLPAAVLVVLHIWPESPSFLPEILNHAGSLPAVHPYDGEALEYGRIYVAPPDFHLIIEPGVVRVIRGPKENRHRPAVDPLFRSAAAVYRRRVAACVISGSLDDGVAGSIAVRRHGGVVIVQDPAEAAHRGMPQSVIANAGADSILALDDIPGKFISLSACNGRPVSKPAFSAGDADLHEVRILEADMDAIEDMNRNGKPSAYACPDCNGTLWELDDNGLLRFRCRIGHAYTASSLSLEQSERVEEALWTAFRALEETASLHRRMADRARSRGHTHMAAEHEAAALNEEESSRILRDLVLKPRPAIEQPAEVEETEE
jgi:two-component system chemotaxis response regulator CheB